MKCIRFAALLLLVTMVLPLAVSAYGSGDQTLIITHINTAPSTEGSAIIVAGSHASKLGEKGTFAWWTALIFDWDAEQGCFVLTESNTNSNNMDKSSMRIPENGFAYCICVGNDYSSTGGINYITDRVKASNDYAKSLPLGTKAYLYGTSLAAGSIQTNGKQWYAPDFTSDSYLKIGTPDSGKTAYDPIKNKDDLPQLTIKPNHFNDRHYAEQDCNLFDASFGEYVKNTYDYSWWRCLVFDWNSAEGCYTVIATDTNVGSNMGKYPVIPKNGFVLLDCASAYQANVSAASVGTKAYFYKEGSSYTISLNVPVEGKTAYAPKDADKIKAAPVLKMDADVTKCTPEGYTVEWEAVSGAKSYTVAVYTSTSNRLGKLAVEPTKVTGTSYEIPAGLMEIGGSYTVSVSADNSAAAMAKLYCFSPEALQSSLADKKILAFGDSLTARTGWVAMLGGYIGTEVINAGVGGDSTIAALARLERDVLSKKPDVALVCFGMNDQAQSQSKKAPNVSLETYTQNMRTIIEELQAIGTQVILITPHDVCAEAGYYVPNKDYGLDYAYGNMKDFCITIRNLAQEYGCGLIDIYAQAEQEDLTKFLNASDGIHQSPYGHELWAKYVSDYLLAVYDGKNQVTVNVNVETDDGEVLEGYSWIMAAGAYMYVPRPDGAEGEQELVCPVGNITVSYTGTGSSVEDTPDDPSQDDTSAETSGEVSTDASEDASQDEATGESKGESVNGNASAPAGEESGTGEKSNSTMAIGLICISIASAVTVMIARSRRKK